MSSQFKPDELVAAVVSKLKQRLGGSLQVKQLSSEHFGDDGDIVVKPPAVLVMWVKESMQPNRGDNTRTTYQPTQLLDFFCGDIDLRSAEEETGAALKLVTKLRDEMAGARFTLADGTKTQPAALGDTEIAQVNKNGSWYVTRIGIQHSAVFSGVNA